MKEGSHHIFSNHVLSELRYQTKLAERQFNRVDPDNRLVASTLEAKWEQSLHDLRPAEELLEQKKVEVYLSSLEEELKSAFMELGKKLPEIWDQLCHIHKKSFLRCVR